MIPDTAASSTQKPYAWHVERYLNGQNVHHEVVFNAPDPAILDNLRRFYEVRVTPLFTAPMLATQVGA